MSEVHCDVCEKGKTKSVALKNHYCNSCQHSFMRCGTCNRYGHDHRKRPQRCMDYCPQCNEKLRDGDLLA